MKYSRAQRAEQRQQPSNTAATFNSSSIIQNTADSTAGPVFFWREYEEPYGFLCQWYPCPFTDPEVHPTHVFGCAEQYMMYRKALVIATSDPDPKPAENSDKKAGKGKKKAKPTQDEKRRATITYGRTDPSQLPDMILAESKPGKQKSLARSIPFTPAQLKEWERTKFDVVVQGSYCKFSQNEVLRERLLKTGTRELVEASPQDSVWGIGMAAEFAEGRRADWGSNLLGKALVSVRERLRGEGAV